MFIFAHPLFRSHCLEPEGRRRERGLVPPLLVAISSCASCQNQPSSPGITITNSLIWLHNLPLLPA